MLEKDNITRITTATTTTVMTGFGTLVKVIVPKTLTGTVTVQDSNGTTTNVMAVFNSTSDTHTYDFDAQIIYGIRVVTSAADEVIITWRQGN